MSYSLTPQGVADQLAALYALSDSDLEKEANSIKSDFRNWVKNHFILSENQKKYLNDLPDRSVLYFGEQCWFCFLYRLNITFIYPSPPSAISRVGKWCDCASSTKLVTSNDGTNTGTGDVTFTIRYRNS